LAAELRYAAGVGTGRRKRACVGGQDDDRGRQRGAQRADHRGYAVLECFAGHDLLLVDDALHTTELVGGDFVDDCAGDRNEWGLRGHRDDGHAELVACGDDSLRNVGEAGSGVEGQCCDTGRRKAGEIVEVLAVGGADVHARGHDELAAGQVGGGIGEFDGVGPADGAVGVLPAGDQGQPEFRVLRQAAHGHRHGTTKSKSGADRPNGFDITSSKLNRPDPPVQVEGGQRRPVG
jgi:hypothetical protein